MMKKIVCFLQVRMSSSRLPRKAMADLSGKPMLWHVINRLKNIKSTKLIVVATTTNKEDSEIAELAVREGTEIFRGDVDNVLKRCIDAVSRYNPDVVIKATGDNPLVDFEATDLMVELQGQKGLDCVCGYDFPLGSINEIVSMAALLDSVKHISLMPQGPARRHYEEHVTPYILERPDLYKVDLHCFGLNLSRRHYRLTVDTPEDLKLMKEIYRRLYKPGKVIMLKEVIELLDATPELVAINANVVQQKKLFVFKEKVT